MADHGRAGVKAWLVVGGGSEIGLVVGGGREIVAGCGSPWVVAAKLWLVVGGHGWSWMVMYGRHWSHDCPYCSK